MSEVLVVVDHGEGAVTKPTLELLTLPGGCGEPVAVVFGEADLILTEIARRSTGPARCWWSTTRPSSEYLVAPKAEALDQIARRLGGRPPS